jgi:integrase
MPRRAKGLAAAFVKETTKAGRHADGGGLYLFVRSREAKFWEFHFTLGGKRPAMGLGPATGRGTVSLKQARDRTTELREAVRAGRDPIAERRAAKAVQRVAKATATTFRDVATMFFEAHKAAWRSDVHRDQWLSSLERYAMPVIGDMPISAIDTAEVMLVLQPLWRTKTETASRLRGRIESVLNFAAARKWRTGDNPARWKGHLDNLLPARRKAQRVQHFEALPWREVSAFMQRLRQVNSIPARALEFAILTAARSGEVRGARWSEIDLAHKLWTVPASRIKAAKEHRVPLSDQAGAILRDMAKLGSNDADLVFPGARIGSVISDVTLAAVVAAAGGGDATVHGFRSTFRDWAAEATSHPREVCEAALAHAVGNQVEAAYRRSDLLAKRRSLIGAWATFCGKPMAAGEVVPLHAAR